MFSKCWDYSREPLWLTSQILSICSFPPSSYTARAKEGSWRGLLSLASRDWKRCFSVSCCRLSTRLVSALWASKLMVAPLAQFYSINFAGPLAQSAVHKKKGRLCRLLQALQNVPKANLISLLTYSLNCSVCYRCLQVGLSPWFLNFLMSNHFCDVLTAKNNTYGGRRELRFVQLFKEDRRSSTVTKGRLWEAQVKTQQDPMQPDKWKSTQSPGASVCRGDPADSCLQRYCKQQAHTHRSLLSAVANKHTRVKAARPWIKRVKLFLMQTAERSALLSLLKNSGCKGKLGLQMGAW